MHSFASSTRGGIFALAALLLACGGGSGGSSPNGKTTLIATTAEAAGSNCASGGQRVQVGLDANDSGALEAGEVSKTVYLCNGAAGTTPVATAEQAGANCPAGGVKLEAGGQTTYLCNGATGGAGAAGPTGPAGADGQSVQVGDAGDACPDGGLSFQVGSGELRYVCNGTNGSNGADGQSVEISDAGDGCTYGGLAFRVGTGTAQVVCNGAPGKDGASATVTPDYGDACQNGGAVIRIGEGSPVSVCNGQSVTLTYDYLGWCDYGGYLLQIGQEEPVPVCNGEPGEPGQDAACAYNQAPFIEGVEIPQGPLYAYVPGPLTVFASDPDGQQLSYSISGVGARFWGGESSGAFTMRPEQAGTLSFSVLVSDGCQVAISSFAIDVLPGWTQVGEPPVGPDVYTESIAVNGNVPFVAYRGKDNVVRVAKYQGYWQDTGLALNGDAVGYISSLAVLNGTVYLATGNGGFRVYDGTGWTSLASYHGVSNVGQVKLVSDGTALYVGYLFQNEGETFYRIGLEQYDAGAGVWRPVNYTLPEEGIESVQAYQPEPSSTVGNSIVGGFDLFVDSGTGTPYVLYPDAADWTMTVLSKDGAGWLVDRVSYLGDFQYGVGPAHMAVAGGVVYVTREGAGLLVNDGSGWALGDFAPPYNSEMAVYRNELYMLSSDYNTGGTQLRRVDGTSSTPVANDTLTDFGDYQVAMTIANGTVWSTYMWFSPADHSYYGLSVMKLVLPDDGPK